MAKRLRLRKNYPGEVFLGSYEKNQPERISLSASSPFVDLALRKRGLTDEQIEAAIPQYEIYVPEFLLWAPMPVPLADVAKSVKAVAAAPAPEVEDEEEEEEEAEEEEEEEEEAEAEEEEELEDIVGDSEDLPVDEEEVPELPSQATMQEMTRDELARLSEQLGVVDDIDGTGANGYVTVPDLRRFLIHHVKQLKS